MRAYVVLLAAACGGSSTSIPDAGGSTADAAVTTDAADTMPDAAVTMPDAVATMPDAPAPTPDAEVPIPDAALPDAQILYQIQARKDPTGTGEGSITSTPAGLSCGVGCATSSVSLVSGTEVVLEAMPAPGSYFQGWEGACADTGAYRFCTIPLSGNRMVGARFVTIDRNLIFATSKTYTGNLGGLDGADDKCAEAASGAGLLGNFVALLSTDSVDAIDRLGSASGFVRMDGKPVLDDAAAVSTLHQIWHPVLYDENGRDVSLDNYYVWTGSDDEGQGVSSSTCKSWTSSAKADEGFNGGTRGGPAGWFSHITYSCDRESRLYCAMIDLTTDITIPPRPGKLIYLSKATFTPGSGVNAAHAICNAEKPAGVTSAKALLSTETTTASTMLDPTAMYKRRDGVAVGTGAELLAGGPLRSAITQYADGVYASQVLVAWSGSQTIDATGTATQSCTSWTSATGNAAYAGTDIVVRAWWHGGETSCGARNVICVEM